MSQYVRDLAIVIHSAERRHETEGKCPDRRTCPELAAIRRLRALATALDYMAVDDAELEFQVHSELAPRPAIKRRALPAAEVKS